ncbi:hypothetical protein [Epibacterium ulvae]|uniref:hypothetical protein n=1 Tax=Epibacterium ulvae TaxID=1156985 RepID=UPI00248FA301|nr:hypothetical protein [Epibacterium ulvae]
MQTFYDVFGLVIRSDFTLEALSEATLPEAAANQRKGQKPELVVRRVSGLKRPEQHSHDPFFDITPEVQYMHWQAVGTFVVRSADLVEIEPGEGIDDHLVSQPLLGLVMSIVLERRGVLCLHAGAVNIGGRAALFLGDKGAGKSTTCAMLLNTGALPVTDDLVAVETTETGKAHIRPGFSRMKLWPDSIAALNLSATAADVQVHPRISKIQKAMPQMVEQTPVPAACGFFLNRSQDVTQLEVSRLAPHEALPLLMRFTFMARYGESRLGRDHLIAHMRRCSAFVAKVPMHRLDIPEDLSQLPALSQVIQETVEHV